MEFGFTEEQKKLRKEISDFYANELPEDYVPNVAPVSEELQSFYRQLQKKAGEKGHLTPGWSAEYGGKGWGSIDQGIALEEQGVAGIVWPGDLAYRFLGPGLLMFGTEEQKKKFLPAIARGEQVWFEAFTEPEAGTDEANQRTWAIEDGDDYIVNGQKTFISGGYKPDWLVTEVRTADTTPKHRGLSLLMIPADSPGITIRPLLTMGFGLQNDIFYDNVRVPKKNMLGQLNRGFYHVMEIFDFERAGTQAPARTKRNLEEFVQYCKEEKRNGRTLFDDPEVREKLTWMAVECEVWRLISWHAQWWHAERKRLGPKPYDLSGFFSKKLPTRHAETMAGIMGTYGQLKKGSKHAKVVGRSVDVERAWQSVRSLHAAGTWEVNKIVLATRGLGLPRIPAKFNKEIMAALQEEK